MEKLQLLLVKVQNVVAEGVNVDTDTAKNEILKITDPITTLGLWAIPLVTTVAIVISGVTWILKDEEEKEQKPFMKTVKRILIAAAIVYSVNIILKVIGITN